VNSSTALQVFAVSVLLASLERLGACVNFVSKVNMRMHVVCQSVWLVRLRGTAVKKGQRVKQSVHHAQQIGLLEIRLVSRILASVFAWMEVNINATTWMLCVRIVQKELYVP
jgi:hypothetical protein